MNHVTLLSRSTIFLNKTTTMMIIIVNTIIVITANNIKVLILFFFFISYLTHTVFIYDVSLLFSENKFFFLFPFFLSFCNVHIFLSVTTGFLSFLTIP